MASLAQPLPDRRALENMKRAELQKLCKEYGVRANLKSEELIDLLLETRKPNIRTAKPAQRTVSTRQSNRTTERMSSVIIHDHIEQDEDARDSLKRAEIEPVAPVQPHPPPRTRKAKETQTRLGVGRPVAAGGTGARAVTKSANVTNGKRGKSRSVKPQVTIQEEPEPIQEWPLNDDQQHAAGPSRPQASSFDKDDQRQPTGTTFDQRVADAINPLLRQVQAMRKELDQMNALKAEVAQLQNRVATIPPLQSKLDALSAEISNLRSRSTATEDLSAEVLELKNTVINMSSAQVKLNFNDASRQATSSNDGTSSLPHPGMAPSLLGKRHRDSTLSDVTGVIEEGDQGDFSDSALARKVIRPNRKRPRTISEADAEREESSEPEVSEPKTPPNNRQTRSDSLDFHFHGPETSEEYVDPPPPTNHLPAFYGSSPSPRQGTAHNIPENQHPFNFTFSVPIPPTPNPTFSMPFAYPEPPQSPTPAGHGQINIQGHSNMFQSLGLPPLMRPRSGLRGVSNPVQSREGSAGLGAFLNQTALGRDTEQDDSPSEPIDADHDDDDNPTTKRTMYGTELETDTRFGDFGLEGVASGGFWTPPKF
ncbi:uncharacterized protein BT62DRAFT_927676 [Guyanagaster necrorhizus]|uniref:Uncharacterized protein n=1 Tax=Guyanagaster necrorhizus TaxID=856835 RepID=A0A9P7VZB5_9AGAR|nr:uncharacterized protein BT62DRAFT_927676 [Guyanagaster necrorhizus MCA 3950]KAG7450376.1 hypothetical protein BT62DRAFT_927676 [Guyanagaster necrorhizus MCA 3950]